jgi:5-methylcytosine-specific restriction endonuclease McrA
MQMPWEITDKKPTPIVGIRERGLSSRVGDGRLRRFVGKACPFCGIIMSRRNGFNYPSAPSRDHDIPRSRGGLHVDSNILICCRSCNEDKGSLTANEYRAVRAGLASRLDKGWAMSPKRHKRNAGQETRES